MAGSIDIVQIVMNQGQGLTPLDQQQDFPHQLFGIIQTMGGKLFYQIPFDRGLLPARRFAGRMSRLIGKFHRRPGKAGSLPLPGRRPIERVSKKRHHHLIRISGETIGPPPDAFERHLVLMFQHRFDQVILAAEVLIERSFGNARRMGDRIDAGPHEAALIKKGYRPHR